MAWNFYIQLLILNVQDKRIWMIIQFSHLHFDPVIDGKEVDKKVIKMGLSGLKVIVGFSGLFSEKKKTIKCS